MPWGYRTVYRTGGELLNEKIMSGSTIFWENIFASAQQGCITNMHQTSGIILWLATFSFVLDKLNVVSGLEFKGDVNHFKT